MLYWKGVIHHMRLVREENFNELGKLPMAVFTVVPLVGFILGRVAVGQQNRRKLFVILGMVLNGLPLLVGGVILLALLSRWMLRTPRVEISQKSKNRSIPDMALLRLQFR